MASVGELTLELISRGPHSTLDREKEIRRRLFTIYVLHKTCN